MVAPLHTIILTLWISFKKTFDIIQEEQIDVQLWMVESASLRSTVRLLSRTSRVGAGAVPYWGPGSEDPAIYIP